MKCICLLPFRKERMKDDISGDASADEDNDNESGDNIDGFGDMTALTKLTPLKFEAVNSKSQVKLRETLAKFEKKAHCLLAGMTANSREFSESDVVDESDKEGQSNHLSTDNMLRAKLKPLNKVSVKSQGLYEDRSSERRNPRRK